MSVLGVIPARGGSKGVPNKNLRDVAGRPLLAWSVLAGVEAETIDRVVVSSDSTAILSVAEAWGAEALQRPPELATDTAATDPVLIHVVEELGRREGYEPEAIVLLQPTVPLREPGLVDRCVRTLQEKRLDFVFTGWPAHFLWWRATPGPDTDARTWETQCPRRPRRQDMVGRERMFHEDGSVYVTRRDFLLHHRARLYVGGDQLAGVRLEQPIRMELVETEWTPDIDTERDLAVAAALLTERENLLTRRAG